MKAPLECLLYVHYACFRSGSEDAYYVEPQGFEVWLVLGKVMFGEGANGGLLAGSYCFERVTEARGATELDLYEDEGLIVTDDEVYFAATLSVVTCDEPVSTTEEVAQREVLAPGPSGLVGQSPTPA